MQGVVVDSGKLAAAFVSLADTLVDDFDVVDLLYLLVTRCVDLTGASAAGLLLADRDGVLRVAAASSENARLLELFQIQNQQGPCLDCYRAGQPVRTGRLDGSETRWPRFASAATTAGYVAVLALPMRLRGRVVGAMNLLAGTHAPPIAEPDIPIVQAMADVATIAILTDRAARSRDLIADQLQTALDSRVVIEQAKGTLATRLDIDHEDAFEMLRLRARSTRRLLTEVAHEVITTRPDADWSHFRPTP